MEFGFGWVLVVDYIVVDVEITFLGLCYSYSFSLSVYLRCLPLREGISVFLPIQDLAVS